MYKKFTIAVGGKAGEGIKKAGHEIASYQNSLGRFFFQLDDYQSLIKGGHNFSVVSSDIEPIFASYENYDLIIAYDKLSYDKHSPLVNDNGLIFYNSNELQDAKGYGFPLTNWVKEIYGPHGSPSIAAFVIFLALSGLDLNDVCMLVNSAYKRDSELNIAFTERVYFAMSTLSLPTLSLEHSTKELSFITGNQAIALGAYSAGLDFYFGYPMTPASSLMHYLAQHQAEWHVQTVHTENELAAINMAIGATFAGAKAGCGSSGGGFALMQEAFSLAGMVESPLFCVLSSRPGPATGVSTYTAQSDLYMALYQGHGEFPRIVASPDTMENAFSLSAQLLDLAWKFQTPVILLTEKHLSESQMSVEALPDTELWAEAILSQSIDKDYNRYTITDSGVSPLKFPPIDGVVKWNSHEHKESGNRTDSAASMVAMIDKRNRKEDSIIEALKATKTVDVYGDNGPYVFAYGSTTLMIREAVRCANLSIRLIVPLFLEPFPLWELESYRGEKAIVVEMSSTGQFSKFLCEKLQLNVLHTIKKYDGRPFDPIDLANRLREVISNA